MTFLKMFTDAVRCFLFKEKVFFFKDKMKHNSF